MHFVRFGVTLHRLEPAHLEQVRGWRNSDWVRPYMRYQGLIGPEDQVRWFESLDPRRDWYFVAQLEGPPFALFHVKCIDWARACGEAGGFVGDPGFLGRPEPARATLALMDFAFLVLRLKSLEAQYSADLRQRLRFNTQLGYRIFRREEDGFVRAAVTAEEYFTHAAKFRRAARGDFQLRTIPISTS